MKKVMTLITITVLLLTVVTSACASRPDFDVAEITIRTENYYRQMDRAVASAYNGSNVKFRLMVEGKPSEDEASALFNEIMALFDKYSGGQKFWDYYNGEFDLNSYDYGVVYTAEKRIGKELVIEVSQ